MIIYIKMDLALNNLQSLICHQTQPTKSNSGDPENLESLFIAITARSTLTGNGYTF